MNLHHYFFAFLCFLSSAFPLAGQTTERVSVNSNGIEGNNWSYSPSLSADGRYVAFQSNASNLVPSDTNSREDVFVRDQFTGVTTRVSVSSAGTQTYGGSFDPSLSADGRYVAFSSGDGNLVPGDTNSVADIFVHDRLTGTTERVSLDSGGNQGDGHNLQPAISSADGRYVAFESEASNLVPGDTNGVIDIFVHDRLTRVTERVSVGPGGIQGNNKSQRPSISADGRYVAFQSEATSLVSGDTNGVIDVFVYDRLTKVTERVIRPNGTQCGGASRGPSISPNGRYVAFDSDDNNLVAGDTNSLTDVFVLDREAGVVERVSETSAGVQGYGSSDEPSISPDGRYVAFRSSAHLVPGTSASVENDIYLHDRQTQVTEWVSVSSSGVAANGDSSKAAISADGRYVAFESDASNLVPGDTNNLADVFLRDRGPGSGSTKDAILLAGPFRAPIGAPLNLSWYAAPPGSLYWLAWSSNRNGSSISGHSFDLGLPLTILAMGMNSVTGGGAYTSPPVPSAAAGLTVYFELAAQDGAGEFYDSNALATLFY